MLGRRDRFSNMGTRYVESLERAEPIIGLSKWCSRRIFRLYLAVTAAARRGRGADDDRHDNFRDPVHRLRERAGLRGDIRHPDRSRDQASTGEMAGRGRLVRWLGLRRQGCDGRRLEWSEQRQWGRRRVRRQRLRWRRLRRWGLWWRRRRVRRWWRRWVRWRRRLVRCVHRTIDWIERWTPETVQRHRLTPRRLIAGRLRVPSPRRRGWRRCWCRSPSPGPPR